MLPKKSFYAVWKPLSSGLTSSSGNGLSSMGGEGKESGMEYIVFSFILPLHSLL